jgi:hypothetical protein
LNVRPDRLLLSTVRPRNEDLPASCGSAIGAGAASITSRAVEPCSRASTKRPGTVIVRVTFGAAGLDTSTSVTIVLGN